MEKLKFLFQITGQSYLSKDMNVNLKVYVDNIFTHVIDKNKVNGIKDKPDTTPMPNDGLLEHINKPQYPEANDDKLEILC